MSSGAAKERHIMRQTSQHACLLSVLRERDARMNSDAQSRDVDVASARLICPRRAILPSTRRLRYVAMPVNASPGALFKPAIATL